MFGHRKIRGLIASSLYEPLTDSEQRLIERHVSKCEACRKDLLSLDTLVSSIPTPAKGIPFDLVPRLRARILEEAALPGRRSGLRRGWTMVGACAVVLFVLGVGIPYLLNEQPTTDHAAMVADAEADAASEITKQANALIQAGEYTRAYALLQDGAAQFAASKNGGDIQSLLADVAFTHLRWYPQADEAYTRLARSYPTLYTSNPEHIRRLDVLSESRRNRYESLYALDAAQGDFQALETVISAYPGTFVASAAVREMESVIGQDAVWSNAFSPRIWAIETACNRCANPSAIAQLKIELGHLYRFELQNPDMAGAMYQEAAQIGEGALAKLAKDSLEELHAGASGR